MHRKKVIVWLCTSGSRMVQRSPQISSPPNHVCHHSKLSQSQDRSSLAVSSQSDWRQLFKKLTRQMWKTPSTGQIVRCVCAGSIILPSPSKLMLPTESGKSTLTPSQDSGCTFQLLKIQLMLEQEPSLLWISKVVISGGMDQAFSNYQFINGPKQKLLKNLKPPNLKKRSSWLPSLSLRHQSSVYWNTCTLNIFRREISIVATTDVSAVGLLSSKPWWSSNICSSSRQRKKKGLHAIHVQTSHRRNFNLEDVSSSNSLKSSFLSLKSNWCPRTISLSHRSRKAWNLTFCSSTLS